MNLVAHGRVSRRGLLASASVVPFLPRPVRAAEPVAGSGPGALPVRGGTLTALLYPEPPYLLSAIDPSLHIGTITTKVMEGLLTYDPEMRPGPLLAERWEVAADGLSWTFHLRRGVTWHDGRPFTAADVAFSLGVWKTRHARGRQSYAFVTGVDTPDDHTAVFRLSQPAPYLATKWSSYESPIIPRHVFENTDISANPVTAAPIGTGPFRFKEWARGNHVILERNPNYWDAGKPYLDRIVFRFIADASSRAAALEANEAQLGVLTPVPLSEMARLTATGRLEATTAGYDYMAPVLLLQINLRRKPLDERRVRQALAYAINRDALTRTVWFGFGKPATGPVPSVVKAWYTTDGIPAYPFDPKKAEALLDEAGLKRGADGKRFRMQLDPLAQGSDYLRSGEFIKQQLARIGVEVELRTGDYASYVRRLYTEYDFDATVNYNGAFPDPSAGLQRIYWSKAAQRGVPSVAITGYADPGMDRDFEDALKENDPKKRWDLYADMQRRAMTDLPLIPLMEMRFVTVASKRLANHTTTVDGVVGSNFASTWLAPVS